MFALVFSLACSTGNQGSVCHIWQAEHVLVTRWQVGNAELPLEQWVACPFREQLFQLRDLDCLSPIINERP